LEKCILVSLWKPFQKPIFETASCTKLENLPKAAKASFMPKNQPKGYSVIGLMSGTSLDGLDICHAHFREEGNLWKYEMFDCETVPYDATWRGKLAGAMSLTASDLDRLDTEYGVYVGNCVQNFIEENKLAGGIDFICSHGHTVFHKPHLKITRQIGQGLAIALACGLPVVNDFRSLDVELGGQGAPLVPIGDKLLFGEYEACLNLGGIANISFDNNGKRIAFDIAPANLPLNRLAKEISGVELDRDGNIARSGKADQLLMNSLDSLEFYKVKGPKSLGAEWMNSDFYPILDQYKKLSGPDKMRTIVEHETNQIAAIVECYRLKTILATGGGVRNKFFVENLQSKISGKLEIPDLRLVDYKEALVFGFLGVLRWCDRINTLASVTGASRDSMGGKIWSVD
jgi:anhydro-N-acetylmuramic acid kinase